MEFDDIPAHNLLLQWIANYGIFTLAMLVGWLAAVFGLLRTTLARKLLIYLVFYSMFQPVQGTGNFFGPVTLLYFLVIFCVEIVERTPTITRPSVIEGPACCASDLNSTVHFNDSPQQQYSPVQKNSRLI